MEETARQSTSGEKTQINWQDFNYPPLIKLIHFSPSEVPPQHKPLVWMLFATHMIIFVEGFLNLISNSIQASESLGSIRILYTFLFILIFNPFAMFLFYRGYAGICKDKSILSMYMYLQPIAIIFWITFSIVDFLGFNGFIRVSKLYSAGYAGAGTVSLFESLLFLSNAILGSYVYYKVWLARGSLASKLAPRLL